MLLIFKRQPGFVDYSIVAADGKLISVSTWESMEQANAGTKHASTFVKDQPGEQVSLDTNYVDDVVFSSRYARLRPMVGCTKSPARPSPSGGF